MILDINYDCDDYDDCIDHNYHDKNQEGDALHYSQQTHDDYDVDEVAGVGGDDDFDDDDVVTCEPYIWGPRLSRCCT